MFMRLTFGMEISNITFTLDCKIFFIFKNASSLYVEVSLVWLLPIFLYLLLYSAYPGHNFVSFYFSPPISDFDVFNEGKTQSFFESQQAVMTLCTYLEGIRKTMEELSMNQLSEYFNKLLQVSIFYTSTIQTSQVSVLINIIL